MPLAGGVELGETGEEAIRRELMEEIGLAASDGASTTTERGYVARRRPLSDFRAGKRLVPEGLLAVIEGDT